MLPLKRLTDAAARRFAGLLILEQPLPQVVFKGKVVEDAYVVQLVTGSHHDIQSTSKVKATLISEEVLNFFFFFGFVLYLYVITYNSC